MKAFEQEGDVIRVVLWNRSLRSAHGRSGGRETGSRNIVEAKGNEGLHVPSP